MKLLCYFVLFLFFIGCKEENINPTKVNLELGEEFELQFQNNAKIKPVATNIDVEFKLLSVSESRCPEDVTCIWLGNVQVQGDVKSNSSNESVILDFCLGDCIEDGKSKVLEQDTITFELDSKSYIAILKSVTPYPNTTKPQNTKKVLFEISKQ